MISKTVQSKYGVKSITFHSGDYREGAGYTFTFFKDNKEYVECLGEESGEILIKLLEIPESDIKKV